MRLGAEPELSCLESSPDSQAQPGMLGSSVAKVLQRREVEAGRQNDQKEEQQHGLQESPTVSQMQPSDSGSSAQTKGAAH